MRNINKVQFLLEVCFLKWSFLFLVLKWSFLKSECDVIAAKFSCTDLIISSGEQTGVWEIKNTVWDLTKQNFKFYNLDSFLSLYNLDSLFSLMEREQ